MTAARRRRHHRRIRGALVLLVVLLGCERARPAALDSPVAAARCEASAIRSRDVTAWLACIHPNIRDEANRELAREKLDWARFETQLTKLDHASASDFKITDPPPNRAEFGDKVAELRLDEDSLEVGDRPARALI